MPTVNEDLTTVIRLACLIESRSDAEQRALLRTARRVDAEVNANVVTNTRMWGPGAGSVEAVRLRQPSRLEWECDVSRVIDPGNGEHPVALKAKPERDPLAR